MRKTCPVVLVALIWLAVLFSVPAHASGSCVATCTQAVEQQQLDCPAGQTGNILQQRTVNQSGVCNSTSAWATVSNTCADVPEDIYELVGFNAADCRLPGKGQTEGHPLCISPQHVPGPDLSSYTTIDDFACALHGYKYSVYAEDNIGSRDCNGCHYLLDTNVTAPSSASDRGDWQKWTRNGQPVINVNNWLSGTTSHCNGCGAFTNIYCANVQVVGTGNCPAASLSVPGGGTDSVPQGNYGAVQRGSADILSPCPNGEQVIKKYQYKCIPGGWQRQGLVGGACERTGSPLD